jgi:hypothetical protein
VLPFFVDVQYSQSVQGVFITLAKSAYDHHNGILNGALIRRLFQEESVINHSCISFSHSFLVGSLRPFHCASQA